ncbi:MAG: DUF4345 domain-containing protein [Pseudomonadota bacterium]
MNAILTRTTLMGSGAMLGLIGSNLLFHPMRVLEMSDVIVSDDPGLMSELTGPSGVLIVTAALMLLGAMKLRFANVSLTSGAFVYGSYGIARVIGMVLHGVPSTALITATVVELIMGATLSIIRLRRRSLPTWKGAPSDLKETVVR